MMSLRDINKRIVLAFIAAERDDPEEVRARLAIAARDGWLTADELRTYNLACELEKAS